MAHSGGIEFQLKLVQFRGAVKLLSDVGGCLVPSLASYLVLVLIPTTGFGPSGVY